MLADDLDNDGRMDLVLSTMNGNLYHPLKAWPTPVSSCHDMLCFTGCMPGKAMHGLFRLGRQG